MRNWSVVIVSPGTVSYTHLGSVHDRPLVADLGGVHRRATPQLGLGGQTGDLLVLEHISVGRGDQQVNDAGAVDHTGEGNGQRMGQRQTGAFVLVGDDAAVVDTGDVYKRQPEGL